MSAGQTAGAGVEAGRPLRLLWWPRRKLREGVLRVGTEKKRHSGHALEVEPTRLSFMD